MGFTYKLEVAKLLKSRVHAFLHDCEFLFLFVHDMLNLSLFLVKFPK